MGDASGNAADDGATPFDIVMEGETPGEAPTRMFDPFDLGVPALRIDTTSGYVPGLDTIIAFCRAGRARAGGADGT